MKRKPYPKYKPSGVEWLGDVPEHWETKRLKTSALCWVSNVDKVPSENERPIRLCNYTDVYYHDHITPDMGLMGTTATLAEIRRFGLRKGDVLITKDSEEWSDIAVPALVKESAPDLVCGYHLAIIRPEPDNIFSDYLLRAFQSCAINQQFQVAASGVTRYGLPKSSIGDSWLPIPPLLEQRDIAAFLDRETGRIDTLIAKKRELVERMREKRVALISRTVTRGLPPEAAAKAGLPAYPPLKPSGVEWLGDIPKHWGVVPLGYLVRFSGGATPDKSNSSYWDGTIPWVSAKDMKVARIADSEDHVSSEALANSSLRLIPPNSVLIVVRGMILVHSFPVAVTTAPVTINQDMKAVRCGKRVIPDFLAWAFAGFSKTLVSHADESAHGTRKLKTATLSRFMFLLPPLLEQAAIAAYLDAETSKLDALISKIEETVERLLEYRTALITAAVTGKIAVGGQAVIGDENG